MHTCGWFDICFKYNNVHFNLQSVMYSHLSICSAPKPNPPKHCLDVPKDHENGALTSSGLSLWGFMWRTQTHMCRLWQLPPPQFVVSGGREESKEDQMPRLKEGGCYSRDNKQSRAAADEMFAWIKKKGRDCNCMILQNSVFFFLKEQMFHRSV